MIFIFFGEFSIVMPEQNAVVVITADAKVMQAELNIGWEIEVAPLP